MAVPLQGPGGLGPLGGAPPPEPPQPQKITNRSKSETYDFFMNQMLELKEITDSQAEYEKGLPNGYHVLHEFKKDNLGQPKYRLHDENGRSYVVLQVTFTLLNKEGKPVLDAHGKTIVKETELYTTFAIPPGASRKDVENTLQYAMGVALPHALKIRGALNLGCTNEIHGNDIAKRNMLIQSLMKSSMSSIKFSHTESKGHLLWKVSKTSDNITDRDGGLVKFKKIEKIFLLVDGHEIDIDSPMIKTARSVDKIKNMHFSQTGQIDLAKADPETRRQLRLNELNEQVNKMIKENKTSEEINKYLDEQQAKENSGTKGDAAVKDLKKEWKKERAAMLDKRIKQFEELQHYFVDPSKLDDLSKRYRSSLDAQTKQHILTSQRNPAGLRVLDAALKSFDESPKSGENGVIYQKEENILYENLEDLAKELKTLTDQIKADQIALKVADPKGHKLRENKINNIHEQMAVIEQRINPRNQQIFKYKQDLAAQRQVAKDVAKAKLDEAEKALTTAKEAADKVKKPLEEAKKAVDAAKAEWEAAPDAIKAEKEAVYRRLNAEFELLARDPETVSILRVEEEKAEARNQAQDEFNAALLDSNIASRKYNEALKEAVYDQLPHLLAQNSPESLKMINDWLSMPLRDFEKDQLLAKELAKNNERISSYVIEYSKDKAFSLNLTRLTNLLSITGAREELISRSSALLQSWTRSADQEKISQEKLKEVLIAFGRTLELSNAYYPEIKEKTKKTLEAAQAAIGPAAVYNLERIQILQNPAPTDYSEAKGFLDDWLRLDRAHRNADLDKTIATALVNKKIRDATGREALLFSAFVYSLTVLPKEQAHQRMNEFFNQFSLSPADRKALEEKGEEIFKDLIGIAQNERSDRRVDSLRMSLDFLAAEKNIVNLAGKDQNLDIDIDLKYAVQIIMISQKLKTTVIQDVTNQLKDANSLSYLASFTENLNFQMEQEYFPLFHLKNDEKIQYLQNEIMKKAALFLLNREKIDEDPHSKAVLEILENAFNHNKVALTAAYDEVLRLTGINNQSREDIKNFQLPVKIQNFKQLKEEIDEIKHRIVKMNELTLKNLTEEEIPKEDADMIGLWVQIPIITPESAQIADSFIKKVIAKEPGEKYLLTNFIKMAKDPKEVESVLKTLIDRLPKPPSARALSKDIIQDLSLAFINGNISKEKYEVALDQLASVLDFSTCDDFRLYPNKPESSEVRKLIQAKLGQGKHLIDILRELEKRPLTSEDVLKFLNDWFATIPFTATGTLSEVTIMTHDEDQANRNIIKKILEFKDPITDKNIGHYVVEQLKAKPVNGQDTLIKLFSALGSKNALDLFSKQDQTGRSPFILAAEGNFDAVFSQVLNATAKNSNEFMRYSKNLLLDLIKFVVDHPGLKENEKPNLILVTQFLNSKLTVKDVYTLKDIEEDLLARILKDEPYLHPNYMNAIKDIQSKMPKTIEPKAIPTDATEPKEIISSPETETSSSETSSIDLGEEYDYPPRSF